MWFKPKVEKENYVFDWEFESTPRDQNQTMLIFNNVWNVDGFRELLSNDVYFYKRKFIESKEAEKGYLYMAEAYQRLLHKMVKSHEFLAKSSKVKPDEAMETFTSVDSSLE